MTEPAIVLSPGRHNRIADQRHSIRAFRLIDQPKHQGVHVMKVGYAVKCHIVAQQPPRDCAWLAVMERIECIRKMGYVTRARFESQIEHCRVSLGMTYEHAHAVARELTREVQPA